MTRVLVVNCGSSSVKLRLLDHHNEVTDSHDLTGVEGTVSAGAMEEALLGFGAFDAIGHRVVHGGPDFTGPALVTPAVLERLRALTDLAPLHQPKALAGIDALQHLAPGTPQAVCFDTAFHAGLPAAAATYAVPARWRERLGVRRYGFHGLSYAYAARRAAELAGTDPGRLVIAHLGAGASLAAVRNGRSVDTTMGFTPLEGLVMATRSGDVDPGLLVWLLRHGGLNQAELNTGLEREGGLVGLTGDSDMRAVAARADAGDRDAVLGVEVYLHRLRAKIAAMAAALGGLDTLVFTGGIGEHQPRVRAGALDGLGFLGARLDRTANDAARGDAEVTGSGSRVRVLVLTAREEVQVAEETRTTLRAR
ncbi:acetate/propionate family kinase [Nocardiopsis ansamitocini]|uniref:Acetate kinase n=1 Tax=Nocardiopsis ansamitocini TaxID=1670832 RepID=A0A9W6PAC8_9ACTN|nr:acetate/propionate family kinase [Nocardiopsis ansamitocini]GLU49897.1 acetate kinase [Nocardiopsis ansamitocini]